MRLPRSLRQAPLAAAVLVLCIALIGYSVARGFPVFYHTIIRFPGHHADSVAFVFPLEGANVVNPVTVRMAVGGVRLEPDTTPAQAGQGHLDVILDGPTPAAGDAFSPDETHFDLPDGSFVLTLPVLSLGPHTVTAVFADSNHVVTKPLLTDTIHINVQEIKLLP